MPTRRASPARIARSLEYRVLDAVDRLAGRRDALTPPRRSIFVGPGDFRAVGDEMLGHMVELAGLRPDSRVLDIGCGIGRLARPLAGHLSAAGSYAGFDVVPEGIDWCRRRIASRHPSFEFRLVDVRNGKYNPAGTDDPAGFRFPWPDADFDVAAATSVFTHLTEAAARNYLREAARVLRPGGRLLATFFVLDPEARELIAAGRADQGPFHESDGVLVADPGAPEEAVGYEPDVLGERLEAAGLRLVSLHPGSWPGRAGRSYQDLVVAER